MIDNELTKNIKKAFRLNIPREYLVNDKGIFIDIQERVRGMVDEERNLVEIVSYCTHVGIELEDALMLIMDYNREIVTLEEVNKVYISQGLNIIYADETLEEIYDKWKIKINTLIESNIIDYHSVTNIQKKILKHAKIDPEIEIMKARKKYNVVPRNSGDESASWNYKDLDSIMDHIVMSHDVPLAVGLSKNNKRTIKIFSQTTKEVYELFKLFLKKPFEPNTITLFVADSDSNYLNKNAYFDNILILESSKIIIKSSPIKLETAMPFFRYINGEDVYINAVVKYNANINKDLFNYMTDNDPVVSSYISLIEVTNFRSNRIPYAEFSNIISRLDSKATLKLNSYGSQFGSIFEMQIYGAATTAEIKLISNIVGHLLGYYDTVRDYYYNEDIKNDTNIEHIDDMEVGYEVPTSKYKTLKDLFPEVFTHPVTGYGTSCQCRKLQPIIIARDEIDSWNKFGIDVARYPPPIEPFNKERGIKSDGEPDEPLFWYVCPDSSYNKPSLKPWNATDEETSLVPCCATTDTYMKYLETGKGKIANYFEANVQKPKNKIHKKTGVLAVGNFSLLDDKFNSWLKLAYNDNEEDNYYRYGVSTNEYSFLTCVHNALNIKEEYSVTIEHLSNLPKEIYAQEIIQNTELTEKDFNNPFICYRGIEELFNISVHIISSNGIMTPNNQICHIRRKTNNRCILLWYHEEENIFELILYGKVRLVSNQKKARKIFDIETNHFVSSAYPVPYEIHNGLLYKDPFTAINMDNLNIKSQWIDSYGKCRSISCLINFTPITLMFLPMQPFSVSSEQYEIHKVDLMTARSLFSYRESSKIEGLGVWFKTEDIPESIFIPINDTYKSNSPPSTVFPPYPGGVSAPSKQMERVIEEEKIINYLHKIAWWIFILFVKDNGSEVITLKLALKFIDNKILRSDKTKINQLYKLPSNINHTEACKIIFDDEVISNKHANIIAYGIESRAVSYENLPPKQMEYIDKEYKYEVDYDGMANTAIVFMSENNLNTWIRSSDDKMKYFSDSLANNNIFKDNGNNTYATIPIDTLPEDVSLWSIVNNEMILARKGTNKEKRYIYAEHNGKYAVMVPLN